MTTFAVGDIQGCYVEFRELLRQMQYRENVDQLWVVGDLVNRGPENVETLDYLMSLANVIAVLGNHDLHFLAVAHGIRRQSRGDTLDDLLKSPRLDAMIDWLRRLPMIHNDAALGYLMVHAGIPPMWDIDTCLARAHEVEDFLRGDDYVEFLQAMYGNEPDRWREDLSGIPRLRVITNYLTRLRYCTRDGQMELTFKADIKPAGFEPWFEFPREDAGPVILFGHWAALDGHTGKDDFIALDTGCVWGRKLTGVRLDDRKFFTVPGRNR